MPPRKEKEKSRKASTSTSLSTLTESIPPIFDQAQFTLASHRKNIVTLYKIHAQCAAISEEVPGRGIKLTGEKAFNDAFLDMVNRVLPVKKGVPNADKIIKFCGSFVGYVSEKEKKDRADGEEDEDEDEDTPASRFVATLLKHLLKGFLAKDKNVRYRVCYFVAQMVSSVGEMDEDLYTTLRASLLERVRDKETPVRLQAVIALAKLAKGEEGMDLEDGQQSLLEVLVDVVRFDPVADVRRAALLNISCTPTTLPALLTRTRDEDTILRKLVYRHVLAALPTPLILSIAQREEVVRNGLGDREPAVRAAAANLIGAWVDAVGGLEKFLVMLDVSTSIVAEDALLSVFVTRPDVFDELEFDEAYWGDLNPERAFLARVFVDHCINTKDDTRLETALPVVTALAFRIQDAYNALIALINVLGSISPARDTPAEDDEEMKREDTEFILSQMLKLAVNLDYADEIGRRKMFGLVRDMISQEALPEPLVALCLDVLRKLSASERDLIRVVVEVVQELRDTGKDDDETVEPEHAPDDETQYGDETVEQGNRAPGGSRGKVNGRPEPEEMDDETREKMEYIDLRCLALCIGMLERVNGTLQENSSFHGLLPELIVPAVRSKVPLMRERGLICLGLCCLIDRKMALNSFQLFMHQVQTAPETLRVKVLQTVFDLLMVHEADILKGTIGPQGESRIVDFLSHALEETNEIQAVATEGIAKLMLSGMVSDENVLKRLVLVYFSPETADNQALRQCLSYFFPVYCYSSPANQRRLQRIFVPTIELLAGVHRELDQEEEMVAPAQVGLLLLDWTDPQKTVGKPGSEPDDSIHMDIAIDIVRGLFRSDMEKDDKKTLAQLLGKLHVPEKLDDDKVRTLKVLLDNLQARRPLKDTTARNAFARFQNSITKKFAEQLAGFSEEDFRNLETSKKLFEFLDELFSEDEGEAPAAAAPRSKRGTKSSAGSKTKSAEPEPAAGKKGKSRKQTAEEVDAEIDNLLESGSGSEKPRASSSKSGGGRKKTQPPPTASGEEDDTGEEIDLEEAEVESDLFDDEED